MTAHIWTRMSTDGLSRSKWTAFRLVDQICEHAKSTKHINIQNYTHHQHATRIQSLKQTQRDTFSLPSRLPYITCWNALIILKFASSETSLRLSKHFIDPNRSPISDVHRGLDMQGCTVLTYTHHTQGHGYLRYVSQCTECRVFC